MRSGYFPKPVDQIIAECVGSVSQRILPQLIAANPKIQTLSFMWGHPLEIKNTLKEMTDSKTFKYQKFPVVMLFSDIITAPSTVRGSYEDVTLNIVIAMSTDPKLKADARTLRNFAPILRPIFQELINQIFRCGYFWVQSPRELLGREIERYFWGKEGIQGGEASPYNDTIDAIEIKGLKLTRSKAGTSISQNTFMQLVEYFLDQTRATITVGPVSDNTITNDFFKKTITEIDTGTQVYIAGQDFTQVLDAGVPTGAIVGINIEFYEGQILIAKR